MQAYDVVVIGAGPAGLAAATLIARTGKSACVLERAHRPGGRAITRRNESFAFNLGAHALYRGGAAEKVLAHLGVKYSGRTPGTGGMAERDGVLHRLPARTGSLLSTGLLGARSKLEVGSLFARLAHIDPTPLVGLSVRTWIDETLRHPAARQLVEAFVRLSTYANAPAIQSAGAAIQQIQFAQSQGVLYLDDGWQTLVDGLVISAQKERVTIRMDAPVRAVRPTEGGWHVSLATGEAVAARAVVLAVGPAVACALVDSPALLAWRDAAVPSRVACLDVALSRLPRPTTFALGVDLPLYFSVHSAAARVAPPGAALVCAAKYIPCEARPEADEAADPTGSAKTDERELEAWLDRLQPGWRAFVVERRFLPRMVASNAVVTAKEGGLLGRPGPHVPKATGLYVVGDWVGSEGMLLDAALASAEAAARAVGELATVARVA